MTMKIVAFIEPSEVAALIDAMILIGQVEISISLIQLVAIG
jgi:hypothetical protein